MNGLNVGHPTLYKTRWLSVIVPARGAHRQIYYSQKIKCWLKKFHHPPQFLSLELRMCFVFTVGVAFWSEFFQVSQVFLKDFTKNSRIFQDLLFPRILKVFQNLCAPCPGQSQPTTSSWILPFCFNSYWWKLGGGLLRLWVCSLITIAHILVCGKNKDLPGNRER